jgi:hypothetical protein
MGSQISCAPGAARARTKGGSFTELARRHDHSIATCVAFAALLTVLILNYSFRHGRLSTLPAFDDVTYLADGLQRLAVLKSGGVRGAWDDYLRHPPHSPYSECLAAAAFAVFGPHDWAPYGANGLLAFAFFLAANVLLRGISTCWC